MPWVAWMGSWNRQGTEGTNPGVRRKCGLHVTSERYKKKVAQSCPALCEPTDHTVHGTLQARILEWVAFPFSRGSSLPRDGTQVCRIAGGFFTS